MTSAADRNCTFLISTEKSSSVQQDEICKDIEANDVQRKIKGLKNAITGLLAGENLSRVLMVIIRFCINQDDHQIKKLLMLYWEIVPKYSPDGKLLPEMILVCNALRNDLMSPNEYVRGCMLRFLCKLKEAEILESLVPAIKVCTEHRHAYVRRNAALAVYHIHKTFGDQLMPDAPELMEKFITTESDISARRNAFLMLFNEAEHIAIDFLSEHMEDIQKYGDGFALLVLELTRKTCRRDPAQKSRFVRCLFTLLQSDSHAVSYEAAWTLVSLSSAPTAVRACAQTFASLLCSCSDNNVKLIILDRLNDLKKQHPKVLQEVIMDILRVLNSPNILICEKTLDLAIDLVGPRNIEDVIQVLKREVVRAQESDLEHGEEYKGLLIKAIHQCALRFAEVADSVVLILLDFLAGESGYNVVKCVKSIVEQYPSFRPSVLRKLIDNFDEINKTRGLRGALWILGEYSDTLDSAQQTMLIDAYDALKALLGEPPFVPLVDAGDGKSEEVVLTTTTKNVVLSDGTYASVTKTESSGGSSAVVVPHLRRLICGGDVYLGTTAAVALTKIALKLSQSSPKATGDMYILNTLLVCAGLGKYFESLNTSKYPIHGDCLDRLSQCCRVLLDPSAREKMGPIWLQTCRDAFSSRVAASRARKSKEAALAKKQNAMQADDLIQFRQLRAQAVQGGIEADLMDSDDISRAVGTDASRGDASKLNHVYQLSGYCDPVYAEATVTVHDYDIILDILVINRTPNTLTNLTVELATMGDLKLVERPQTQNIGPLDERRLRANIKVSSTETGHIFGTIVFDNASSAQKTYVNLSDIQLNIMDYIRPSRMKMDDFIVMWGEFEWENKVPVNTNIRGLHEFLNHVIENLNLECITPLENIDDKSNLLAANLCAKSVFGEDALVNVSVERKDDEDGSLGGYIRIRSKTQGIALSLGDRLTAIQRCKKTPAQGQ